MKKLIYIFLMSLFLPVVAYSQGEIEALAFSRKGLHGTARSMSMGGAFGALGGDQTAISINPAGIGVYRSSEIVGTVNFSNNAYKVGDTKNNRSTFDFDNLGFVGTFPMRSDLVSFVNFGFSYNRQKSFNNTISAQGTSVNALIDYIADKTNSANSGKGIDPALLLIPNDDKSPDPFNSQPWLSILGYNSSLITKNDQPGNYYNPSVPLGAQFTNFLGVKESGYIDNYDFTIGSMLGSRLNIGMALTVSNISYTLNSEYEEVFDKGSYLLHNWIKTTGAGFGAKFGMIYRPVNEIRIGLAYHTPTFYAMTDLYEAEVLDKMKAYSAFPNYKDGKSFSPRVTGSYNLRTPDKWVLSFAGVLGNKFIVSADYELVDYKNMKLLSPNGDSNTYNGANAFIKEDHKPTSTIKAGMEYRFTPQLSARLGYAWMQNPYNDKFVELANAATTGSTTIFKVEGDTNYFTGGFGYRFNQNVFMDLAVVYQTQTDDLYPFPRIYGGDSKIVVKSSSFELKNNNIRGLITLGYRF